MTHSIVHGSSAPAPLPALYSLRGGVVANPAHLEILKRGVEVWNKVVIEHQILPIDLREADLAGLDLKGIKLMSAWLDGADLHGADLRSSDLRSTAIRRANLQNAKISAALATHARFSESDLESAELLLTNLSHSDLSSSNLTDAALIETNLNGVNLQGANFTAVRLNGAILTGANLCEVIGLETCLHIGPTVIDFYTYTLSGGLPLKFLRGCGLPDTVIEYLGSVRPSAIQFYSCFISYSSRDQEFAGKLHADLQNRGIRCWLATEDLKIGDPFRQRIDESIKMHDKLLLILSEHSVKSPWVADEVEAALERERRDNRLVLFPIRIDDAVMDTTAAWAASIRRTRHIGDFTRWTEHDRYQKAFERLLRDLKAETMGPNS